MNAQRTTTRLLAGVCAGLLGAGPGWAQFAPQPNGQNGPLAFGVGPGDAGAPPSYPAPAPSYPPPQYTSPQYPQPQYQPQPQPPQFQPPQQPMAGGSPSQDMLQRLAQAEREDYGVPPTRQLHTGAPHAPTPNAFPGGQVITTLGLVSLLQQQQLRPVLLDALGGQAHLPGALPAAFAAQPGSFNDPVQQQLASMLQQATGGDRSRPVVVYCSDPHCWMSYNAALRAAALGYGNVLWYRGGLWAWQQAGLPLGNGAQPMPPQAPPASGPAGFTPSPPTTRPLPGPAPQPAPQQGAPAQGGAFTLGDFAQNISYGRNGVWEKSATPDGALVIANREKPSSYLTVTVRQPSLPFTVQMDVSSGYPPREGSAVGAGMVFGYTRSSNGSEAFYALLLAGNSVVLYYHRPDGDFDEISRTTNTSLADARGDHPWATLRVTVREDGYSFSVNNNGEVSQSADGPMTGAYGVMASGMGQGAFRNLRLR